MKRHRMGIIGLGMASTPHARALLDLSERVEIAAAYSPSAERRAAFAAKHGMLVVDSAEAIWGDKSIDSVAILTPPNTHLDLIKRAAAAGKHALLEKPLEVSPAGCEALVRASEEAGITVAVMLQNRFRPVSQAFFKLMSEGRLGDVVSASARLLNWRPQSYYDEPGRGTLARDGGGVLMTQAIHTLDLYIALVGLPKEVSGFAVTSAVHRMETEDLVAAAARFANGAIGSIFATTTAYPGFADQIEVIGTKGSAVLGGNTLAAAFHDGTRLDVDSSAQGDGSGADPMAFSHENHRAVYADLLDAIDQGRKPTVSGRDALKAHRLIEALLEAAQTGERVAVRDPG